MGFIEKSMLLDELSALYKADREERDKPLEKLDWMTDQLLSRKGLFQQSKTFREEREAALP